MTEYLLHTIPVVGDTLQTHRSRGVRQLSAQGVLQAGTPVVQPTGVEPGQQIFRGLYRGDKADVLMAQLTELAESGSIEEVALFGRSVTTGEDGYYTISDIDPQQPSPASREFWRYDLTVRNQGTRKTHWRSIQTAPTQPANGTDFGNDTTGNIGVDSNATRVRWFEPETENREDPTLVATRNAQHGDVEIYDAEASTFDQPVLIFDLDYEHEGKVDAKVWDDLGNDSRLDGSSNLQWARVFDPGRVPERNLIVENGLLRLTFDEVNNTLSAEDWNDGTSSWDAVSLGSSNWELFDVDVQTIGMATVRAYVEFRDPTTSPDSFYALDMVLGRGQTDASWFVPANEGDSTPAGLQTKLNPIADSTIIDPTPTAAVTERSEVRK